MTDHPEASRSPQHDESPSSETSSTSEALLGALVALDDLLSGVSTDGVDAATPTVELELRRSLDRQVRIDWTATESDAPPVSVAITYGGDAMGRLVVDGDRPLAAPEEHFLRVVAGQLGAARRRCDQQDMIASSALFDAGFASARIGMQVVAPDGTYLRVNDAFATMVGRTVEELVGSNWRDITAPEHRHERRAIDAALAHGGSGSYDELKCYERPDGTPVWASVSVVAVHPLGLGHPEARVHLAHVVEVTDHVEALERSETLARELEASERRHRSLVEPSVDLIVRLRADGRIVDANPAARAAFGIPADMGRVELRDVLAGDVADLVVADVAAVTSTGAPRELWRQWLEPVDRAPGWFVLRVLPEQVGDDGYIDHAYLVASDISELVESEQHLSTMAHTDALTGIPNRAAILGHAQRSIDELPGLRGGVALALVDLDDFKLINDQYGHAAGDRALETVAAALHRSVRSGEAVGRLGGDEFVVVFHGVDSQESAARLGERLATAISSSHIDVEDGQEHRLSGSVGVAFADEPLPLRELLAAADQAMYDAKEQRGGSRSSTVPRG